jgi:O-antigen/teichoic acid export membrane protein
MRNELPSKKRTAVNVLTSWVHKGVVAFASLVSIPIIIEILGFEGLGVWLMVMQFARMVQPINMGISGSLGRLLARADALGDSIRKDAYISVSVFTLSALGALICIGGYIGASNHTRLIDVEVIYQKDFYWAILIALTTVGIGMPMRTGLGMLEAKHKFYRISLWELMGQGLWIGGLIFIFNYGQATLFSITVAYFLPFLLKDLILFIDGLRVQGWPKIALSNYKYTILKEVVSLGLASGMIAISVIAIRQGAPMAVGYFLGFEALSLVSISIMVIYGISPFINITTNLIVPVSSKLSAKGDTKQLCDIYIVASKYTLCLALTLCLMFYFFGKEMLHYWLGSKITQIQIANIYDYTLLMFVFYALSMPGMMSRSVLISVGLHWKAAKAESWSNWTGFAIGLVLISATTKFGASGMVVGICIAFALRGFGALLIYLTRYFRISIITCMSQIFAGPLIALAIGIAVYFGIDYYSSMHKFLIVMLSTSILLIFIWILVVENKHKTDLKCYLAEKIRIN